MSYWALVPKGKKKMSLYDPYIGRDEGPSKLNTTFDTNDLNNSINRYSSTQCVQVPRANGWGDSLQGGGRKLSCPGRYSHKYYVTEIQRRGTSFLANATSEYSDNANDSGVFRSPQINGKTIGATLDVVYKYSRAYTLKGTALSIISISLLAVQNLSDFTPSFFLGVLQALLGGCLANLYVVGINQLSDIEIDKVNKPYLVLASGELPVKTGILLTSFYALLGLCLGWSVKSWPFRLGLFLWYAFGTAYSVHIPLLRWKRIPVLAAMCLWSVQGTIVPVLFHLHALTYIKGRTLVLSKHALFVSGIMSIYGIVIALFKDVPDVEGDRINGINSFALQFGQKRVFWICIWLLEMANGVAILTGLSSTHFWIRSIMVIGHGILGLILWRNANLVDLQSNDAIESFYLFIWKLYYAEYLLVPILRF
uniref:homogentisate phytyltransferase 1, chloroplastic-like n=1 Tax=Erigeron canadensis TaxID=72917 RepID=UPI001CB9278D|nr:homogentisate phytyltransferase 1, chloroplastic-like [Erigeron canadensis]